MSIRLFLLVALWLVGPVTSLGAARDAELLRSHIALAKERRAYLQLEEGAILVYVKGVKLERLPVRRVLGPSPGTSVARVTARVSAVPLPKVVVDSEEVAAAAEKDRLGSVSSLDEIVSVNDMPETYMVELSDGSTWYVTSEEWTGVVDWTLKKLFQYRVAFRSAREWITHDGAALTVLNVEPRIARRLFWLLREDMGVIH